MKITPYTLNGFQEIRLGGGASTALIWLRVRTIGELL